MPLGPPPLPPSPFRARGHRPIRRSTPPSDAGPRTDMPPSPIRSVCSAGPRGWSRPWASPASSPSSCRCSCSPGPPGASHRSTDDGLFHLPPMTAGTWVARMRLPRLATVVAVALTVPLLVTTTASAAPAVLGGGDPYFPAAGNGGYDVAHYGLGLTYDPATGRLDGTAVITLTATTDLDSFSLDLRNLQASSVLVDTRTATFTQVPPTDGVGGELVVTLSQRLRGGSSHVVTVVYGGVPGQPTDQTDSLYGWGSYPPGAVAAP